MDGDDGAETARRPASDDDVLVLGPGQSFEYPVRIRHGLATHKPNSTGNRRERNGGARRCESRLGKAPTVSTVPTRAQERGASTVKAIVDTAASLFSRPTSVTSTCSTKLDRPCRTIQASARAGPTTTGDRK